MSATSGGPPSPSPFPIHSHFWQCLYIREGNGNPLQYSCLKTPINGGAW